MPENDQAAQELNDMTMAEAKRLEDAGDYAAAGAMYLALATRRGQGSAITPANTLSRRGFASRAT